jgi:maleylacetoacetate isomerase
MSDAVLYDYWRSSSAYRVRIALQLKGVAYRQVPVNLLVGEQRSAAHIARNAQGLVPALDIDGRTLTQSLAIIEYLDETRPDPPLLPADPAGRQRVRALSYVIAMEIHPVCNQSVARHAASLTGDEATVKAWMHRFIPPGLAALERMLDAPETGRFSHGDAVTMADLCLIPQIYNARRWEIALDGLPRIGRIAQALESLEAFRVAHPDRIGPPPQSPAA